MDVRRPAAFLALVVLLALAPLCAARAEPAKGVVVEKVMCSDGAHSYALYLPTSYSPDRKWPILFCFDPAARGVLPVSRFKAAAEKYGWIVVGSNDSRNGPVQPAVASLQAMWRDVHTRFAVDDARVYFTGFSGGSRVASRAALLCGCAAGVIGTGAGFPEGIAPAKESAKAAASDASAALAVRFAYFGVVGTDDFNYGEMRELARTLDALELPNRLAVFDGAQMWPPEALCAEAVAWMEVRAMKEGRRPRDEAMLAAALAAALEAARASEHAGSVAEALARYRAAVEDFGGLTDVSAAEAKVRQYEKSGEVKRALQEEDRQIRRQRQETAEVIGLWASRGAPDENAFAAKARFRAAVRSLDEAGQKPDDSPERRVARRTLYSVFAYFIETGMGLREQGKYREAIDSFQAAVESAPRNAWPLYELARTQARDGNAKGAVQSLARAVELGFASSKDLAENPDWAPLRADPAFKALAERVGAAKP
jgi:tetratricopeptide (TPR) repeat protein